MKTQNIFDNEIFFNSYRELREREDNLNVLLEQPAMAERIPNLEGASVLDIGCGYGHNCLDFVARGAAHVVGIDISERMLAVAATESSHERIEYRRMDMREISKLDQRFDFIYSSLAFHYCEDFSTFIRDAAALLNPNGVLLFSQEHPIVTATIDGMGHFNKDELGNRVSYTFSDYNRPGKRIIHWYVDGVEKYHRPMGILLTDIAQAGLMIEEVCEPTPKDWALEILPTLTKEYIKSNFLIIKARKLS